MRILMVVPLFLTAPLPLRAQSSGPIRDNSFLVEEAYNQPAGVIQHISTFARATSGGAWLYTFTQEWPVTGQRHQASYTIPIARAETEFGGQRGIGDVALNYRYQAGPMEGVSTAFAPRISMLLPTGSSTRGQGAGGFGMQVNLPFSAELPASLVTHTNVGGTWTPRARGAVDGTAATTTYALGQSVIWLAHPRLNLMLEGVVAGNHEVIGAGITERTTDLFISPGIRGAIDLPSGLQIVPGLAIPIGVGASRGQRSVFLYLSLEHPFTGGATALAGAGR